MNQSYHTTKSQMAQWAFLTGNGVTPGLFR